MVPPGSMMSTRGCCRVYRYLFHPQNNITGRLSLPAARLVNPPPKLAQEIAVLNRNVVIDIDSIRIQLPQ